MNQDMQTVGQKKLLLGVGLVVATFAVGRLAATIAARMGLDTIMIAVVVRSLMAVTCIFALGGGEVLRFDWHAVLDTWKFVRPLIIINIILGGLTLVGVIAQTMLGEIQLENTLYWGGYVTFLCLMVGINEEGMFRALMLDGFLARWGATKEGVLKAAIVSSLLFGAAHVILDVDLANGWSIATGLMKTLETGMFGFIFCSPVIKNKNIWGAITAHGFFDWIILCGNTIAAGGMEAPTYVATDPTVAKAAIFMFAVMSVLYLPRTIRAAKEILAMEMPQYGPFIEE